MKRVLQTFLVFCVLIAVAIMVVDFLAISLDPDSWVDMRILFRIIEDWWTGEEPLFRKAIEADGAPGVPSYVYPPVWGLSVLPLVLAFDLRTAIAFWAVASLAVLFGGILLLLRHLGIRSCSPVWVVAIFLTAIFAPVYESFYGPTKDLMMVGLVAATYVFADRGRYALGGLTFAGAIALKIYPVFFGLYFLLRKDWRLLLSTGLCFVAINVLPMPVIGTQDTVDFYLRILPAHGGSVASPENSGIELPLMALRWLDWFRSGVGELDLLEFNRWIAFAWRVLVLGGFTGLSILLGRRDHSKSTADRFLPFALWTAAILLLIPVAWVNYQIFLLLPMIGMLHWLDSEKVKALHLCAALLFFVPFLCMTTPVKTAALSYFIGPEAKRSRLLAMTVGTELDAEFQSRVAFRARQVASLGGESAATGLTRRQVADWLRSEGVLHGGSRGTDYADLQLELERVRSSPTTPGNAALRGALERRLRVSELTTTRLVALLVFRSLLGILIFLGIAIACMSLLHRAGKG